MWNLQIQHQLATDLIATVGYIGNHSTDLNSNLLNPNNMSPKAWMWQGVVELQDGHPEKATEPFDRAAELAPNDLNILEYRGKAHSQVAFASYARMAVIDPTSWHVHRVQGQMYSQ